MASQQARISLHFTDGQTKKAVCTAYCSVDDAQTLAALQTDVATFATAVYNMTSGKLTAAELITVAPTAGLNRAAAADSRVYETGVVRFSLAGTTATWSLAEPTLLDSVLVGQTVPLDSGTGQALITAMLTTITHLTFESPSGAVINGGVKAFQGNRKHYRITK